MTVEEIRVKIIWMVLSALAASVALFVLAVFIYTIAGIYRG